MSNPIRTRCRGGYCLCPVAENLWREVGRQYDAKDWARYSAALTLYCDHDPHDIPMTYVSGIGAEGKS